jgi:hypothetical protein
LDNYVKSGAEFVKDGTVFRNRIRYRAMAFIPINHKTMSDNTLFLNVTDEVFLGFGEGQYFGSEPITNCIRLEI